MAIVRAVKTGVWSDVTTWNTGALPTSADDVYSNTFTVTIDVSPTVLSISNAATTGVTAGGGFVISANGITLTCTAANGIVGGGSAGQALDVTVGAGNSCSVIGNSVGGSASNSFGIRHNGAGTLSITGNSTGGSQTQSHGVNNAGNGTLNVTGNATGGAGTNADGVRNNQGLANLTGSATGGAAGIGYGFANFDRFNHVGSVFASTSIAGIGPGSITQVTTITGPLISTDGSGGTAAASGINPCVALRWFPADTALSTFEYRMRGATVSGSPSVRPARQLFLTDAYAAGYPSAGNVRNGTAYGPGSIYTGTCAVPGASSVVVGVPVDNTTGTAAVTAATIRAAVGLASANLDTQLAAIPTTAAPTAAAIRSEMDANSTKLANLDATVSSRSTYAGGDTSGTTTLLSRLTATRAGYLDNISTAPPSAASNASAVRAELSTELSRIDTTVSSRLPSSGYTAPPSVGDIATAVWAAATRTLTTAIDNSATIAAAVWGYATGRTITGGTVDTLTNAPSVPSAATIASQVRTELAPELAHLDADVSSRLKPADTLARVTLVDTTTTLTNAPDVPTEVEIAEAVRTELSPELARLANAATTQEVGDIVEGAMSD